MKICLSSLSTTITTIPPPPQLLLSHRRSNFFQPLNLRASSSPANSSANHQVVVTRERGKNDKLITALAKHGINSLELPLIQHRQLPDSEKLTSLLSATGKVLASELPKHESERCTVLYPASAKASDDIEEGLSKRGFQITRLNTYTTESVQHVDQMILQQALSASVVAVASPSAVSAWVNLLPEQENWSGSVACIGETTASAARKLGFRSVYYPSSPSLQGWVDSILDALRIHNQFLKV
ncbi:hypothetical protein OSB04_003471 [Centaurea solstitialis]|uniref:Uroporphyrinogen-III synthase n=1 Tax=Centaurea solstitialis TaxID=347529 RepID=A0AA38U6L1_9ASTR|nr:hypothetical protein OSB04_003471 [Centaurea solstitialis]